MRYLWAILLATILIPASAKVDHHNNLHKEHVAKKGGDLDQAGSMGTKDGVVDHRKLYLELFRAKRRDHLTAIQSIVNIDVRKQRLFLEELIVNLKKILEENRATLERIGHVAEAPFPHDSETLKESVSKILENIAFFSDLAIRFPGLFQKKFNKDRKLQTVIVWAYDYSKRTGFMDDTTVNVVDIMAKVLEFVPKEEGFVNAFDTTVDKDELQREAIRQAEERMAEKERERKTEKKGKKKKGPSMAKSEL